MLRFRLKRNSSKRVFLTDSRIHFVQTLPGNRVQKIKNIQQRHNNQHRHSEHHIIVENLPD